MASCDVNVFQRQQLINREMVTKWRSLPGLVDKLIWDKDKAAEIGAQNNTGKAMQYRRPSYVGVGITETTDFTTRDASTDLSSSNLIPNYVQTIDAVGNMYIQYKVETNLQFSLQDLMYWITDKDKDLRFLDTAIAQLKDQVSLAAGNTLARWVGQTVELDTAYSTIGQNVLSALGRAKKVMLSRRGTQEAKRKIALFNMDVLRAIAPSAASLFNFGRVPDIQGLQEAGFRPGELDLYGFATAESALLPDVVIPSTTAWPTTVNLSAA